MIEGASAGQICEERASDPSATEPGCFGEVLRGPPCPRCDRTPAVDHKSIPRDVSTLLSLAMLVFNGGSGEGFEGEVESACYSGLGSQDCTSDTRG